MHLKFGLLTIDRFEYNYGTSLQQYATLQIFNQLFKDYNINADIEIIDYVPDCRIKKYTKEHRKNIFQSAREQLKNFNSIILDDVNTSYFNARKFYEFEKQYLNISKDSFDGYSNLNILNLKYDFLILGSDQTLNPYAYYLEDSFYNMEYFINKNQILTYAPSMGVKEYPSEVKNRYLKTLKSIKFLSGREIGQCKLVNEMLKSNKMQLVLDPTLLLSKEHYEKLENPVMHPEKYFLVISYGGLSDDKIEFVNNYACKNNLEIIQIGNFVNKNWKFLRTGPAEFLYLIHNADIIFTDAYHGTLFSFIYNKNIIYFERENIRTRPDGTMWYSRFESLEQIFNIKNAKYIKGKAIDEYESIDYSKMNLLINKYQIVSKEFLTKELNYVKNYKLSYLNKLITLIQYLCIEAFRIAKLLFRRIYTILKNIIKFIMLNFHNLYVLLVNIVKRIFIIYKIMRG